MKNLTISIEEDVLEAGRDYAKTHGLSLNALIRKLLSQVVSGNSASWIDECFQLMDRAEGNSKGVKWSREDLYDV